MQTVPANETVSRSIEVDGDCVNVTVTAKPEAKSPEKYVMDWTFDFGTATREDILRLATQSLVILMQRKFREAVEKKEDLEKFNGVLFDVAELISDTRQSKSPVEKAESLVAKMSEAQKAELLKMLQSQVA